ncbi:MAG: hypothetical protein RI926_1312 [Actinomycetota bacterium]|jgi:hypothetical protein
MAIDNSDKAWNSVLKLRARAQVLLAIFLISFIVGIILVISSVGTLYSEFGYSTAESAVTAFTFGILLISIASTAAIGWFFAVSMANHSEVVYFSSASNKERVETVIPDDYGARSIPSLPSAKKSEKAGIEQAVAVKCSDCGAQNDEGMTYCRICGGYLN